VGKGKSGTAPSSLAGIRSHLSTEFELLGRTGEWNAETLQGNPTWSPLVRRLTKGYKAEAEEQGYQQKGAVPLAEDRIQQLLTAPRASACSAKQDLRQHQTAVHQGWPGNQLPLAIHCQRLQCRQHQARQYQATNQRLCCAIPDPRGEAAARSTATHYAGQDQEQERRALHHSTHL
jgi:hypothetical protein